MNLIPSDKKILRAFENKEPELYRTYFQQLTLKEYTEKLSVKGKHRSWKHAHIRSFNRSWNKDLTKLPCQKCNYSLHIELCHIKDIAAFDENTTLGEVNHPDNILVLCRNCHWEFDNGYLDIKDIPSRNK